MRAGASIAKDILRRINERFAINRSDSVGRAEPTGRVFAKHDLTASRVPKPRRLLRATRAIGLRALFAMRRRVRP